MENQGIISSSSDETFQEYKDVRRDINNVAGMSDNLENIVNQFKNESLKEATLSFITKIDGTMHQLMKSLNDPRFEEARKTYNKEIFSVWYQNKTTQSHSTSEKTNTQ